MELCVKRETEQTAVTGFLKITGCMLLLWACPALASDTFPGKDYLYPAETRGGNIHEASAIESSGSTSKQSLHIQYEAFDGQFYDLVENRGRYVNVLVPETGGTGSYFTPDHLEELVDRLDILYTLYAELLQAEPAGSGLLKIAFIPQTCGMGCGLVGGRGIEIKAEPSIYQDFISELDAGRLDSIFPHEMAHNFDTLSSYLHYLPDHAHAWTDMFEFFAPYRYARDRTRSQSPEDLYNSPIRAVWKDYVTEDSAHWDNCVKDQDCAQLGLSANNLWAMLYYRIEALYGVEALLGSFEFIREYSRTHAAPRTVEEKEGLRILSLGVGAQANISCYVDALKWPVPNATRQELQMRYGNGAALCADQDGDGFIAINGDCDDSDPLLNINGNEIAGNDKDDDCDELVDEKLLIESTLGSGPDNFIGNVNTSLPTEIRGSTSDSLDFDVFAFALPPSGRARVTLCAQTGFRGWAAGLKPDGSGLENGDWYVYRPDTGCTSSTFDFSAYQQGRVAVSPDEYSGNYFLTISAAAALEPDYSDSLMVRSNTGGGVTLHIDDAKSGFAELGADELEVWVSGAGVHWFEAVTPGMKIRLDKNRVPNLGNNNTYQARIRPRAQGLPLRGFTTGQLFSYDARARSLPEIDHTYSGAWFDPDHDGEGFIVEILDESRALVYWFTYQADGSQRWMLGVGDIVGNRVEIEDMLDTRGGRFGKNYDPDDVILQRAGSLSMTFLNCTSALINYNIDSLGDHQAVTRLTDVFGHSCGKTDVPPSLDFSGSWYDPSHDGEGFVIEQVSAGEALVFWFTYDDSGRQTWLFNTGAIEGNRVVFPEILQSSGGKFGRSYDPSLVDFIEWGSLTLELDCTGSSAVYNTQKSSYSDGSQSLVPLTRLQNSGCLD